MPEVPGNRAGHGVGRVWLAQVRGLRRGGGEGIMSFRPIENARTFRTPPRCQHETGPSRDRCPEPATVWLVSGRGLAISHECQPHADAVIAEYNTQPEIEILRGWTTHPITIEEP